jgi:hypothetical protein
MRVTRILISNFEQQVAFDGLQLVKRSVEERTGHVLAHTLLHDLRTPIPPEEMDLAEAWERVKNDRAGLNSLTCTYRLQTPLSEALALIFRPANSQGHREEVEIYLPGAQLSDAEAADIADDLLPVTCETLQASFAGWTPAADDYVIEAKLRRRQDEPWSRVDPEIRRFAYLPNELDDLPRMRFVRFDERPTLPLRLYWLNYWSADVARELTFPDLAKDQQLVAMARKSSVGAWILKLTADPLDIERSEHVQRLAWAYQRFSLVGARI